jgi:hypothetical protein
VAEHYGTTSASAAVSPSGLGRWRSRGQYDQLWLSRLESRTTPRGRTDREVTQAARRWAKDEGAEVRGALHARVLASYQLHAAGLASFLGEDSLIPEATVQS